MFRQDADEVTFRMIQKLQEIELKFVRRAGKKQGKADGLSRRTADEPDWVPGERGGLTGSCLELVSSNKTLERTRESYGMAREKKKKEGLPTQRKRHWSSNHLEFFCGFPTAPEETLSALVPT